MDEHWDDLLSEFSICVIKYGGYCYPSALVELFIIYKEEFVTSWMNIEMSYCLSLAFVPWNWRYVPLFVLECILNKS